MANNNRKWILPITFGLIAFSVYSQENNSRIRFVLGASIPEALHTGVSFNLNRLSQFGVSAGIAPEQETVWSLNAEHRLYLGRTQEETGRKKWFFRQSASYYLNEKEWVAITLSFGLDLKSKHPNRGWTMDIGIGQPLPGTDYLEYFPAIRIQHYWYFKKVKS